MSETQNQIDTGAPAYAVPQTAPQTPPEEPARMNAMQRLIGTIFSPGETFKDINRKPTWLIPILISMVLFSAGSFFYEWRAKPDWDKQIRLEIKKALERRGQDLPPDQIEKQVDIQKKVARFIPLIAPVFVPIGNLVLAGIFALGMMLLQAKTTFKKIFSVVVWTSAGLGLVGFILRVAVLMTANEEALSNSNPRQQGADLMPTHIGWFLPDGTSGMLKSFADSLDVFSFWVMIVMAIGLAAVSGNKRITTKKTFTMLFGLWLVYVLIKVAVSSVFG
jgi:Yip1 domain